MFLDRDGTINVEIGYLHEPEKFRFEVGVPEALRMLKDAGYKLVVVTNQGAVGRGMYTEDDLRRTNEFMQRELMKKGVALDGIYYCIHRKEEGCHCRKPEPGMMLKAMEDLQLSPDQSWMIGDKLKDIEAGKRSGLRTILVLTGYGVTERQELENLEKCVRSSLQPSYIAPTLKEAAMFILQAAEELSKNLNSSPQQ